MTLNEYKKIAKPYDIIKVHFTEPLTTTGAQWGICIVNYIDSDNNDNDDIKVTDLVLDKTNTNPEYIDEDWLLRSIAKDIEVLGNVNPIDFLKENYSEYFI